jgi:hypothetical protein
MVVLRPRSIFWSTLAVKITTRQPEFLRGLEDGSAVVDTWKRGNGNNRKRPAKSRKEVGQEAEEGQDLGRFNTNQKAEGSSKQEQEV